MKSGIPQDLSYSYKNNMLMYFYKWVLNLLVYQFWIKYSQGTIDLNSSELQYLADHLTPEECRKLVAAAHFKSFEQPNALDQAERKVPKDISCIEHLHHWNSQSGEGKGQTHEILTHRLRQMGKLELAEWLGKTVFHELGVDLDNSIEKELTSLLPDEGSSDLPQVMLEPLVPKIENPTNYSILDYILYSLGIALTLTVFGLCFKLLGSKVIEKIKKSSANFFSQLCITANECIPRINQHGKIRSCFRKTKKYQTYDIIEADSSGSEYEDNKFDVRMFTSSSRIS